jgi:molybdenum ABC transporter molybdate-binding protein
MDSWPRYSKVPQRCGKVNGFLLTVIGAGVLLVVLGAMLWKLGRPAVMPGTGRAVTSGAGETDGAREPLVLYCAAGIRPPVEQIVADYQRVYGEAIQIQYGGSNTLLSQTEVSGTGDLYLAADESYTLLGREKGLVRETIPLATMRPVIAVRRGNPKQIRGLDDLLRDDVTTAIANPDQAAIGKTVRRLLQDAGKWDVLQSHVTRTGVFKPTVPEVANDVKLGAVDAGIIWDTTVYLYDEMEAVTVPEFNASVSNVTIAVLSSSKQPTRALRFARFLAARDQGLVTFTKHGFQVVEGDPWAEVPELTFFCGAVNRRAVESVVKAFSVREGVTVNTVYNGCGILTAQMRTIRDKQQASGFPDNYMACDRYYLDTVGEWFHDGLDVSDTEVVIAVPKGNPAQIQSLQDLTRPGVRVSVGQPDQCTIGVLTRQVLEAEHVYDAVMQNVVTQTASSALLIPTVVTGSVDATLAYATDTRAESDKVDAIRIESSAAQAIQPLAISRTSKYPRLSQRLQDAIASARSEFEQAGFHFRLADELLTPSSEVRSP